MPTTSTPAARVRGLRALRLAIDAVDDGLVLLLASRTRLAGVAGRIKADARVHGRDAARERRVVARASRLADALGMPPDLAADVFERVIDAACRAQGLAADPGQCAAPGTDRMIPSAMHTEVPHLALGRRLLRRLPPPRRLAPLVRAVPPGLRQRVIERAMAQALVRPLADGSLEFMRDRRLGIEVSDLGIAFVVELQDAGLRVVDRPAEAVVRGTTTDLLLLAGRLEDADTLFFQRRLVLAGDTELGLTARNLLDRLPWEQVPLALRIVLNRGARLADAARAAHHARA